MRFAAPQAKIPPKAAKQAAMLVEKTKDLPVSFPYTRPDADKKLARITLETLERSDAASAAANLIRGYINVSGSARGNPGLGVKRLTPRIAYLRHANGVRVFFRDSGKAIEVLVIADKGNEQSAISHLMQLKP